MGNVLSPECHRTYQEAGTRRPRLCLLSESTGSVFPREAGGAQAACPHPTLPLKRGGPGCAVPLSKASLPSGGVGGGPAAVTYPVTLRRRTSAASDLPAPDPHDLLLFDAGGADHHVHVDLPGLELQVGALGDVGVGVDPDAEMHAGIDPERDPDRSTGGIIGARSDG